MDKISVKSLDSLVVKDFASLLSQPPDGWCWCVAWEVPTWDGWGDRSAEENQTLRESLWVKGEFDGYVLYSKEEPIGWIRVGPTTRWPKLATSRGMELREDLYIFTCLGMRPEKRRQGTMRAALQLILDDLRSLGITEIAAIPKKLGVGEVDSGEIWNGPQRLYEDLGFKQVREDEAFAEFRLTL